ncbi:MAG: hypothetical protein JNM24_19085 [Bdellovibrionaceae bacterium]|nr:hypothetical protein [Pseudobdellovibrionaceae bacterium]
MFKNIVSYGLVAVLITSTTFANETGASAQNTLQQFSSKKITDFSNSELKEGLGELRISLENLKDQISKAQFQADNSWTVKIDNTIRNGLTGAGLSVLGAMLANILMRTSPGETRGTIVGLAGGLIVWGILSGTSYGVVRMSQSELNEMKGLVPQLKFQIQRIEAKLARNVSAGQN